MVVLLVCPFAPASPSAATSRTSRTTVSLPKSLGSIEGRGESFRPTLNNGTAKYGIALKLPPGTAGHSPDLRLVYEGGTGNGPLGNGWQLPPAFVQRAAQHGSGVMLRPLPTEVTRLELTWVVLAFKRHF